MVSTLSTQMTSTCRVGGGRQGTPNATRFDDGSDREPRASIRVPSSTLQWRRRRGRAFLFRRRRPATVRRHPPATGRRERSVRQHPPATGRRERFVPLIAGSASQRTPVECHGHAACGQADALPAPPPERPARPDGRRSRAGTVDADLGAAAVVPVAPPGGRASRHTHIPRRLPVPRSSSDSPPVVTRETEAVPRSAS